MRTTILLASLAAAVCPAAAQDGLVHDWRGIWAHDLAWCGNADRIGSATPAPISISATEVLGYENSCRILETEAIPELQAKRLRLTCQSEGEEFEEGRLIMMSGPDRMWLWSGGGEPIAFSRCPGTAQ